MKVEKVVVHRLQPADITEGFCVQHSISRHSADDCREQLQLWSNLPGEVL